MKLMTNLTSICDLPHELIAAIGDHLAPKYRCRLFICCKVWHHECYSREYDFFKWCSHNNDNSLEINKIKYEYNWYMKPYMHGAINSSIRIVPQWNNRRTIHDLYVIGSDVAIYSNTQSFSDYDGIEITLNTDVGKCNYRGSIADFYYYTMSENIGNDKILYDNFAHIIKYLNINDIFRLWVSLGFKYQYLLHYEYRYVCKYINEIKKEYNRQNVNKYYN